jgi:predicted MFS family arabinose efflux permease
MSLISVASTISVGIGYPVAGLVTEIAGVRAAYFIGVVVSLAAFLVALKAVPKPPPLRSSVLDVRGALLLAFGIFPVILVASETSLWSRHLAISVSLVIIAALILSFWWSLERRTASPLVDVRLLRRRAVTAANSAMFIGGVGMYLLLTLITRYSQTLQVAGYGFGLTTFTAGLVLVPLSVAGFLAGRIVPRVRKRLDAHLLLTGSSLVVLSAFAFFALGRSGFVILLLAMAILGFGVGSFSAAMPAVILIAMPKSETSSAMSFNLVVRSVGFSLGSALGGLILAAGTSAGGVFPSDKSYTVASLVGGAAMVLVAIVSFVLARQGGVDVYS